MRAKALLLRCLRRKRAHDDGRRGLLPSVPGALLHFTELAAQPELVRGTEEDHDAVSGTEILFVVLAHVGFVASEDRTNDLEALIEQKISPGGYGLGLTFVVQEVHAPNACGCRCRAIGRTRRRGLRTGTLEGVGSDGAECW